MAISTTKLIDRIPKYEQIQTHGTTPEASPVGSSAFGRNAHRQRSLADPLACVQQPRDQAVVVLLIHLEVANAYDAGTGRWLKGGKGGYARVASTMQDNRTPVGKLSGVPTKMTSIVFAGEHYPQSFRL